MTTYFSIGEIAKMFNISTQTLRLYDRIDLLKPAHIKRDSGYRYYSIEQFVKLDCIKMCKTMGLSLEEIKELIGNDSSIESMVEIVKQQKKALDYKIAELNKMKSHFNSFENRINESLKIGFNNIVLANNEERYVIKYKYTSKTNEELEVNLRKVIIDAEEKYGILNSDIGFTISYKDIINNNKVIFKDLAIHLYDDKKHIDSDNISVLPKGIYLTMYIDDSSFDNRKYYNQIIEYAKENNIEVIGDFIETEIIARVNKEGKGNNLAKIELLCK